MRMNLFRRLKRDAPPVSVEERAREVLAEILDPELGINLVDLGLVYGVKADGNRLHIAMTMTTPACPLGAYMQETVTSAMRSEIPELESVEVEVVWEPAWSPDRMSDAAKRQLGWR